MPATLVLAILIFLALAFVANVEYERAKRRLTPEERDPFFEQENRDMQAW